MFLYNSTDTLKIVEVQGQTKDKVEETMRDSQEGTVYLQWSVEDALN